VIVYLDSTALVKRYIAESGSVEVARMIERATVVGTAVISRAEVAGALAGAARLGLLPHEQARAVLDVFRAQWSDLVRLQLTETVVSRADAQAWDRRLRANAALHLAAALVWQEALGEAVTFATYDRPLWQAARASGLSAWPEN